MQKKISQYIQKRFSEGRTESEIIEELKSQGWSIPDINLGMAESHGILLAQKLMPAGALLRNSWADYLSHWKLYFSILFWPMLVQAIPLALMDFYSGPSLEKFFIRQLDSNLIPTLIFLAVWVLSLIVVSTLSALGVVNTLLYKTRVQNFRDAYELAVPFFWSGLWLMFLVNLIIVGSYFFFIIPGFLYQIWFSLYLYILVDRKIKGTQALLTSKEYIRGEFRGVISRFLLIILLSIVMQFIIAGITEFINLFPKFAFPEYGAYYSVLAQAVNIFLIYAITPFWLVYIYHLYLDLKKIKGDIPLPKKSHFLKPLLLSFAGWMILFASIGIIVYSYNRSQGVQTISKNLDLLIIQNPLSVYAQDNKRYPERLGELVPSYIDELPKTFVNEKNYRYTASPDGKNYKLCVVENSTEIECAEK